MMFFKVGALTIPTLAALDIEQTYAPLGGEGIFRTIGGTGIKQMTWQRQRVTTAGSGWLPAALAELDTSTSLVLACITPRAVACDFASRQATMPAKRRSDAGHTPWGVAILPDGGAVNTPLTLSGNVATLTAVAAAVDYQAIYLPQYTVWAMRPTESGSRGDASYRWELVCEEV